MTRRPGARRLAAAGAGAAAAALACVRVDVGPSGVASARLDGAPPSIVVGDVLRDSAGNATVLAVRAFDESDREIATAPVRFFYVPDLRDSAQRRLADTALVVDSVTGAVRATGAFVLQRALVAVRVGDRLQLVDTLDVVPRPDSARLDTAVTLPLRFLCGDTSRTVQPRPIAPAAGGFDTLYAYNALGPFRVRVRGDSAGTRVGVRARLVRWRIVSAPAVPAARLPGGAERDTVPAIALVSDANLSTRPIGLDTTDAGGASSVRLFVRPFGLGPDALPRDTFTVRFRADVQPGPGPIARDSLLFSAFVVRGSARGGPGCQ